MQAHPNTLLVWDFDWSLIEVNSDTFVIGLLGAEDIFKRGKEAGLPWTQLMDRVLEEAASQLGRTRADVEAALHATPLHPALGDLLRAAAAVDAAESVLLSDANTVYIDEILRHHGLRQLVSEVLTNPAEWRGGALRVAPHHARPHGCPRCPANLCKGRALRELVERRRAAGRHYGRLLYVGDGRGDHCPAALLLHGPPAAAAPAAGKGGAADRAAGGGLPCAPFGGAANRVFARRQYPDGLPCALWAMLGEEAAADVHGDAAAAAAARVVPWRRPDELARLLRRELGLPPAA